MTIRGSLQPKSEVIRRLAMLRRSFQRRSELDEIIIKGRTQIENIQHQDPDIRFKEILVSDRLESYDFLRELRAWRIHRVDPKLLYYIAYQSKPMTKGTVFDAHAETLSDADAELLKNPAIADSLMVATLPSPKIPFPSDPRLLLCLDRVIFPDNVGTLVQSAHAIGGVGGVVGTSGTCDFNGWKVLEASKGFGFGIPKARIDDHQDILRLVTEHNLLPIVGHSQTGVNPRDIRLGDEHRGVMVIVGNEKHGPSKEILDMSVRVRIPINERMNSLNVGVAGAILLQIGRSLTRDVPQ